MHVMEPSSPAPGIPSAPPSVQLPVMPNAPRTPQTPTALLGMLSYIHLLCLVPLFSSAPGSFEAFHALQGLWLAILGTIGLAVSAALPGVIGSVLFSTILVAQFVLTIIGTRNVYLGQRERLPLLGMLLARTGFLSDTHAPRA